MNRMIASGALLAWGLGMIGCGPSTSEWVGTWVGERQGMTVPEKEDAIAKEIRTVVITIRADGTYDKTEASIPSRGNIKFGKGQAFLKDEYVMDKRVDADPNVARQSKEMILEKSNPDTILYWDPGALTPGAVTLRRQKPSEKK